MMRFIPPRTVWSCKFPCKGHITTLSQTVADEKCMDARSVNGTSTRRTDVAVRLEGDGVGLGACAARGICAGGRKDAETPSSAPNSMFAASGRGHVTSRSADSCSRGRWPVGQRPLAFLARLRETLRRITKQSQEGWGVADSAPDRSNRFVARGKQLYGARPRGSVTSFG